METVLLMEMMIRWSVEIEAWRRRFRVSKYKSNIHRDILSELFVSERLAARRQPLQGHRWPSAYASASAVDLARTGA